MLTDDRVELWNKLRRQMHIQGNLQQSFLEWSVIMALAVEIFNQD